MKSTEKQIEKIEEIVMKDHLLIEAVVELLVKNKIIAEDDIKKQLDSIIEMYQKEAKLREEEMLKSLSLSTINRAGLA